MTETAITLGGQDWDDVVVAARAGVAPGERIVVNMGPQHPSTHGVLRLEVVTDGEVVIDVVPGALVVDGDRPDTAAGMRDAMAVLVGRGLRAQLAVAPETNRLPAYQQIAVPVQVIGFADDVVLPPHLSKEVADAIPLGRYLEIPDAGHAVPIQCAEKINTLLRDHFAGVKRGVSIEEADGFSGLPKVLPPPPRRGLVHIDPPYEMKDDYKRVLQTLKDAIPRFATGTYAIWYPEVARMESQQFGGQLRRLGGSLEKVDWLHATLRVKGAEKGGLGLYGSGMFIINPPWTLYDRLAEALPWLVETIGLDDYAAYTLEAQQS